jgi:hypothetical protein
MRSNGCFSFVYALYLLQMFIIVVISPGTTVVMLTVSIINFKAFNLPSGLALAFGFVDA